MGCRDAACRVLDLAFPLHNAARRVPTFSCLNLICFLYPKRGTPRPYISSKISMPLEHKAEFFTAERHAAAGEFFDIE